MEAHAASASTTGNEGRRAERDARLVLTRGLHVLILWTLAAAQPLFDLLRRNPEFFAIRGSSALDIVVFAVGLVVVPPLAVVAVEALAGFLDARVALVLHLLVVAVLVAAIVLPVLKRTGSESSGLLLPAALAVGAGAAALYARWRSARVFLTVLSPAAVLFVVLFLFFSPVTELVTGDEAEAQLSRQATDAPVVMLVLDELPLSSLLDADGGIDARRYPNFAALARGSHWFRNTAAVDAFTQVAVPAILTGRRPTDRELPSFSDHPDNLFTLLGAGHRLHVQESITSLCPRELCRRREPRFGERMESLASDLRVVSLHLLLPDDLRERLPSIDSSWQDFRGGPDVGSGRTVRPEAIESQVQRRFDDTSTERRRLAEDFVAEAGVRGRKGEPPLEFAHLLLPHVPWQYLPDGRAYGQAPELPGLTDERWDDRPGAADTGYQRHLLQLAFLDRLLGRLVGRLRARGLYDEALVAVVADHGVAFRPGLSRRKPERGNAVDLMAVPFFVKAPGQRRPRVVDTQLETVDVLPTIASLLGVRVPWRTDGRSAFAPSAGRDEVTITEVGRTPITLDRSELERGERATLRRKLALFGPGGGPLDLYRFGAGARLVGRSARDLPPAPRGALRATLDDPGALTAVDPATPFLPVHVTGRVSGGTASHVALAVNGTIGAVTRPVPDGSSERFSAVVPPRLVRGGRNRLEVLAVRGPLARPALAPLLTVGGGPEAYRLVDGGLRTARGRTIRVVPGRIRGVVDRTILREDTILVGGWAAGDRGGVQQIAAFSRGRLRWAGAPAFDRPDLAPDLGVPAPGLGFGFELPRALVRRGASPLEVYAVDGRIAGRLPLCIDEARRDPGCPVAPERRGSG